MTIHRKGTALKIAQRAREWAESDAWALRPGSVRGPAYYLAMAEAMDTLAATSPEDDPYFVPTWQRAPDPLPDVVPMPLPAPEPAKKRGKVRMSRLWQGL